MGLEVGSLVGDVGGVLFFIVEWLLVLVFWCVRLWLSNLFLFL